jgi:putative acyl-CoA dehydrogenase
MTQASLATHEVFNQSPPFEDVDLFALDRPLADAVAANGGASARKELSEFGKHWGSAAMAARGRIANENTPKLRTFDARRLVARPRSCVPRNSIWRPRSRPVIYARSP